MTNHTDNASIINQLAAPLGPAADADPTLLTDRQLAAAIGGGGGVGVNPGRGNPWLMRKSA